MKKVRILSIDGGGIKGILPATILRYVENQLREKQGDDVRLCDYIDLFAGTSTGGILSLLYNIPNDNNRPAYTSQQALDVYRENGDDIFEVSLFRRLSSVAGLIDEKYSSEPLNRLLDEYCGDYMLAELIRPCMITAYDFRNRNAKFFTSYDANNKVSNFFIRDVARATSAAPTYFEPVRIYSELGTPYSLIDGGVFANNPALCAYSEARKMDFCRILGDEDKPDYPTAKDMMIFSISTGTETKKYKYREMRDRGLINWVKPIIDILMSGNSETVHYQLKQIWSTLDPEDQRDYYRLNPSLHNAKDEMDDASDRNVKDLHEAGLIFVERHQEELDEIIDRLIEYH